jgi:hypothetical protein
MRGDNQGGVLVRAERQHQLNELIAGGRVKAGGRFVGQQQGGFMGDGPGKGDSLGLAAGELARQGLVIP